VFEREREHMTRDSEINTDTVTKRGSGCVDKHISITLLNPERGLSCRDLISSCSGSNQSSLCLSGP